MGWLLTVGIFVVSVLRRPIDSRLKRRYLGPSAVVLGFGLVVLAWLRLYPAGTKAVYLAGELCGVCAVYLFTCTLVLATRLGWLEPLFGGLDQEYRWHRSTAAVASLLLIPHVLLTGQGLPDIDLTQLTTAQLIGASLAVPSVLGIGALVLVSLPRVAKLLHLRYEHWLVAHRFIGLFLLVGVLHGLLIDFIFAGSLPLKAIYLTIGSVGLLAYAYAELAMRHRTRAVDYLLTHVNRLSDTVLELLLQPRAAGLTITPGQFVFLRIGGDDAWREHPFTVAGASAEGQLRLTIRSLGDDTTRMHERLQPGLPATITGPFGMFDHTVGGARQIWVAGGIGVAPFLSWLAEPDDHIPDRVDLYYTTPTKQDAIFAAELEAAARRHPAVTLHLIRTRETGHLSVDDLTRHPGGQLDPKTHVFLCGPAAMVEDLTHGLRRQGLPRDHVHSEHFAFR